MDSLLECIVKEITRPYKRLSVISNPDGFLSRGDTICALKQQADITVLCLSQLELRVWFELDFKDNPDISIRESDILFRRKFYNILKLVGPGMLGCTQKIEKRSDIDNNLSTNNDKIVLPNKPVIFAANHGFRDDVLATVLAAGRHGYIFWGSLPLFYNTFNGFASSLVGTVMVNRRSNSSKHASIDKSLKTMSYGADLIIFPEGGWNKTSEKLVLDLWRGIYLISKEGNYPVVPISHYVRDMEIVNKKNIIHTVVDEPIPMYEMSEKEALTYLRDILASWQYKMAELYGRSTREEEMKGFTSSDEKWHDHLNKRMKWVDRYDSEIEKQSELRRKEIVRPEDVFRPIANIKNVTSENILMKESAKKLVKQIESNDFQKLY